MHDCHWFLTLIYQHGTVYKVCVVIDIIPGTYILAFESLSGNAECLHLIQSVRCRGGEVS